jgi:uncharacterized protein (DUF1330 family)
LRNAKCGLLGRDGGRYLVCEGNQKSREGAKESSVVIDAKRLFFRER